MRLVMPLMPSDDGRSGIYRYMTQVARRLLQSCPADSDVRFPVLEADLQRFAELPAENLVRVSDLYGGAIPSVLWHLAGLPASLLGEPSTVLLLPAGNRRLSPLAPCPSVVVVHDLNQLDVTDKYDGFRMFYARQLVRRGLQQAHCIAAVSEHTAHQLQRVGIAPDRITVVPNGVDADRFTDVAPTVCRQALEHVGLPPGYLLYVSRIEHPGKNHVRLLQAYDQLRPTMEVLPPLLLAGSDWNGAEVVHETVAELGLEAHVHFGGFVPDELLPALYAQARALVFPSLAEGFGLPLLEAMAAGCPVLCSDRSPMRDIVGDAGLTFDPESPSSIATQIATMIQQHDQRAKLIERGRRRARSFDWRSHAKTLWQLAAQALPHRAADGLSPRPASAHGENHGA